MAKRPLGLFTVFHCNLLFSSIEEEDRAAVVARCYHPILDAAERFHLPLGFEATGLTLEAANAVDPAFVARLRRLCAAGTVEFVGSGYAQLIGPLAAPEVNRNNLTLGLAVAERLLGVRPRLALVNEQAWSAGLVGHYCDAGFAGVILDFENPRAACRLSGECAYAPVRAAGPDGRTIPVLFNQCVAFQKFQRHAQGELELTEYLDYLGSKVGCGPIFSLYCSDAEVFDYRPGRFETEAELADEGEWNRIARLFEALGGDARFAVVSPSAALAACGDPERAELLPITSAAHPCVVKKQLKYNITRWAVTGRDDLRLNAAVNTLAAAALPLDPHDPSSQRTWKHVLALSSSDYRTHITDRRWRKLGRDPVLRRTFAALDAAMAAALPPYPRATAPPAGVRVAGDRITLATAAAVVTLDARKGLAVTAAVFPDVDQRPLAGLIPHGYFEDISLAADFFFGHFAFEAPGRPKVTDLIPVTPAYAVGDGHVTAGFTADLPLGRLRKTVTIFADAPRLDIAYDFDLTRPLFGSLRLLHVTLPPWSYDRETLFFRASQGGGPETFPIAGQDVEHGRAVSFLVSASQGVGATDGVVELGDKDKGLRVRVETPGYRPLGLVTCRAVDGTFFFRLAFSALETDETSRPGVRGRRRLALRFSLTAFAASGLSSASK